MAFYSNVDIAIWPGRAADCGRMCVIDNGSMLVISSSETTGARLLETQTQERAEKAGFHGSFLWVCNDRAGSR